MKLASLVSLILTPVGDSATILDRDLSKIVNSENVKQASHSMKRFISLTSESKEKNPNASSTTLKKDNIIEEIGLGPGGGRLLRFRDNGDDKNYLYKSTRKLKKARSAKGSKRSQTKKTNKCTKLVAEDGDWKTWQFDVTTFTPIFRPATDDELREIVKSSKRHGCKIRMMGARHSAEGMVMQRKEQNVVVISLASHVTEKDGWHDAIYPESSTFRIGAGKSWYDVSALIRPHGYVLNSRSAGAFFSVGGVVANMVHGGGRTTGFMHDDVVRMLVLTSDGKFKEVQGDDLKYWRSSAGLLGMIVAIEMMVHSEAIPYVMGINHGTGELILDEEKGGLKMERESTIFDQPTSAEEFNQLVEEFTTKVYTTGAMYDSAQFFYDYYTNTLAEYRANYSGQRFSGLGGPFADAEKAARYKIATDQLTKRYSNVSFDGGEFTNLDEDTICDIFCIPPTGPPPNGDGSPCIQIPSFTVPGKLLCEVPIETAVAISSSVQDLNNVDFDDASSTTNDGFFLTTTAPFEVLTIFFPARSLGLGFGTWYDLFTKAVMGELPDTNFFPNLNLEMRFIDPEDTAVLNPLPTIDEVKDDFNKKYAPFYGENAFDLLIPPIGPGAPDGFMAMEFPFTRNIFDDDKSNFILAMQEAWSSMPTNPLLPYGEGIVKECDSMMGIFPCTGPPKEGLKCCNPPIPTFLVHLGKFWGYGVDPSTTPTTGKVQPFKDANVIANTFATGPKKNSIDKFNAKRDELDADVFSGGAMMRWLDPSFPNSEFEVRMLDGQMCGSPDFAFDPDKECINDNCVNSVCE